MTSSLDNVMFGTPDGKELFSIDTIDELKLTDDSESDKGLKIFMNSKEFSCEAKMSPDSVEDIRKHIVYGGDRGRYNGYVLRRDGYLNLENAWLGNEDIVVEDGKYYTSGE